MTNYNESMKMPLGKRKLRELIEDAWYDAPSASAGFGRIEVIIEQQIEAEHKKHEIEKSEVYNSGRADTAKHILALFDNQIPEQLKQWLRLEIEDRGKL